MSYSTLYVFYEDGDAREHATFKNAFGSAARVWEALSQKYARTLHPEGRLPFSMDLWQEIWKIEDVTPIPWWEHNVLHWTFDKALIRAVDVPLFIESLEKFSTELPAGNMVSHLGSLAKLLTKLVAEGEGGFRAIGFQHTSAADEAWQVTDPETEECLPYNMVKQDQHYFIEIQGPDSIPAETLASPS